MGFEGAGLEPSLAQVAATEAGRASHWCVPPPPPDFEGYMTKFAPHTAVKLIARCKLTVDERVVAHDAVRVKG